MYSIPFLDLPALCGASGTVHLPGSKSISNRVLLLAALCEGTTVLHDVLESDDTRVMLDAIQQLGCRVTESGRSITIQGLAGKITKPDAHLFMGNAGTAMRPLTAALAVLGGDFELRGVPRMHERPIRDLVDALKPLGCHIDYLENEGYPPLRIGRPDLQLQAPIKVRGDVSSQFLTALLMALPLVAPTLPHFVSSLPPEGVVPARGGPSPGEVIVIEVEGELISKPYIEITLNLLARFGVEIQREGWQKFIIPAGSKLTSPGELHVEADASSASYFIAIGAISARTKASNSLRIEGVGLNSIQGDIRFVDAARSMGASVTGGANWLEVSNGTWPLIAIDLDCNHIPDAAMTLAMMALYADGTTTLRNIASWRVKETDRIAAMACELRKLGAQVGEGVDFIRITPPTTWKPAVIHTYDDHRMAMCFSLASFNPAPCPVRILEPQCVAKTFPDYFETFFSVVKARLEEIPVICIDGPTASGKGTLATVLARRLGYGLLDSGSLYRACALAAQGAGLTLGAEHEPEIAHLAKHMDLRFVEGRVLLDQRDVTDAIRTETAGMNASKVSALPQVRTAMIALQHSFQRLPGLVADGRDMGTVIFPRSPLKVFLTASAEKRAERRHKQLISKGISATLPSLRADLEARDARDSSRAVAPLKPAEDALLLDNSEMTVEESVDSVLDWWQGRQPFLAQARHGELGS